MPAAVETCVQKLKADGVKDSIAWGVCQKRHNPKAKGYKPPKKEKK